jgi:hypothetical protein
MRSTKIGPRIALIAALLMSVGAALLLPVGSLASTGKPPHVATGGATHLRGTTAQLEGAVYPDGVETTYYFQYGPTAAYGSQTAAQPAGNGSAKVPVGVPVSGLTPGVTYHFRIVGTAVGYPTLLGHERTFVAGGSVSTRLAFRIVKPTAPNAYGHSFLISGTLAGSNGDNANVPIALQASPYPYLEPFVTIGATGYTNASGAFSFRVRNLASNTQFRVVTVSKLPVYSSVITEQVALNVTLHVALTKRVGVVRLYGFVTPAMVGKPIVFQLEKAVRPNGRSESETRFVPEFSAKVKQGGKTFSRFSTIVEIRHAGRYRAEIKLEKGAMQSGISNSVTIKSVAPRKRHRKG